MFPENVASLFLIGKDLEYILFRTAIHYAENGNNVWYIAPEVFENIPENINTPDKEILQMITFIYLKDYKQLLNHLNKIHLWPKLPTVIICTHFESYAKDGNDLNCTLSAYLAATLLDCAATCRKKNSKRAYLIASCELEIEEDNRRYIRDFYFTHLVHKENNEETFHKIISCFI